MFDWTQTVAATVVIVIIVHNCMTQCIRSVFHVTLTVKQNFRGRQIRRYIIYISARPDVGVVIKQTTK